MIGYIISARASLASESNMTLSATTLNVFSAFIMSNLIIASSYQSLGITITNNCQMTCGVKFYYNAPCSTMLFVTTKSEFERHDAPLTPTYKEMIEVRKLKLKNPTNKFNISIIPSGPNYYAEFYAIEFEKCPESSVNETIAFDANCETTISGEHFTTFPGSSKPQSPNFLKFLRLSRGDRCRRTMAKKSRLFKY